jgi:hypothetical protein
MDVTHKFDTAGWVDCPSNHYIREFYRSGQRHPDLINAIEKIECCAPPKGTMLRRTEIKDVSHSFDHQGWSGCPEGSVMGGIYRSGNQHEAYLYNIEKFDCFEFVSSNKDETNTSTAVALSAAHGKHTAMKRHDMMLLTPFWGSLCDWVEEAATDVADWTVEAVETGMDFVENEVIPVIKHYGGEIWDCGAALFSGDGPCVIDIMPEQLEAALGLLKSDLMSTLPGGVAVMRDYFKAAELNLDACGRSRTAIQAKPNLAAFMGQMDIYAEVKNVKGNAAITASVSASVTTPPGKFASKNVSGITVSEGVFLWKGHKWDGTQWLEAQAKKDPSSSAINLNGKSSSSGSASYKNGKATASGSTSGSIGGHSYSASGSASYKNGKATASASGSVGGYEASASGSHSYKNGKATASASGSVGGYGASVSAEVSGPKGDAEFGISGTIKTDMTMTETIHVGPWVKMDCGSNCPANLVPTMDAEQVPVTANTLNALKSGVSVSASPVITWDAALLFFTEVTPSTSGVCVKLKPDRVELKVTSGANVAKTVLTFESQIDWVDRLSTDIGRKLSNTMTSMFNPQGEVVRAISLAIEAGLENMLNSNAMTHQRCAW